MTQEHCRDITEQSQDNGQISRPVGGREISSITYAGNRTSDRLLCKREDGNDTIKELKWETLENRRRKTRITSLYRSHIGQKAWVDITARLEKPTYYGRNDHDFKIKCRKQKTDVGVVISVHYGAGTVCSLVLDINCAAGVGGGEGISKSNEDDLWNDPKELKHRSLENTKRKTQKKLCERNDVTIVDLRQQEHSSMTQRQIAAECHIGLATVNSIIKRYRDTGSITPQKKGNCGRKRKTSPADDRLIVRKSKLNPRLTTVDLTRELMATTGANIHVTTVRRRILEAGPRARPGALILIKGMMNSDKYIHLLETRIVSQLQKSFPDGRGVFQQDLAPCHTSRKTTEFFNKKNIQVLPWPGNSPDINPIENLWSICKRRMQKMDCSTKEKMISALIGVWFHDEEMKNICGKLVESMPNRLRAVIRNKGGHIDY
ncbi:hypothetical protein ANN_10762 [Periplaneta americana]|uniref:Tc1-like transposase DDE domain-containing protein n=1 Tax=Periplaneta americana TaxID=6978 RepID=A0ABQ8T4D9_PERAM|nr:hypothetical protein ANN_10762 [Periplaneta americana]